MSEAGQAPERPMVQKMGAVLWPSFFSSSVATLICLFLVDHQLLLDALPFQTEISEQSAFAVVFLLLWLMAASSSLFTWLLLRPACRFNRNLS